MNVLIVDDEHLARLRLRRLLENMGHSQICEASNGEEAIQMVEKRRPTVVFLDVQMPIKNGLQVAAEINQNFPDIEVVLCTAFDEYALQAFEHTVKDYLLKPVTQERLSHCLKKLNLQTNARFIQVKRGNDLLNIGLEEIACLVADGKYVTAHLKNTELIVDESLLHYEKTYAEVFVRIHRNALINRLFLIGIHQAANNTYQVILRDSELRLNISRRQVPTIRELLTK